MMRELDQGIFERGPRIMIHTCNKREWYVYEYLIPSLVQQGIGQDQIKVWHDYKRIGNLQSFIESCKYVGEHYDPTEAIWHIQDDVLISSNFKQEIEKNWDGVVCGFVCKDFDIQNLDRIGLVPAKYMWFSFQCIRIPNSYCKQFYDWMYEVAVFRNDWFELYKQGKHDDSFWRFFMMDKHFRSKVVNLKPNIVEHVDWALGYSIANSARGAERRPAYYWGQEQLTRGLVEELRRAGKFMGEG